MEKVIERFFLILIFFGQMSGVVPNLLEKAQFVLQSLEFLNFTQCI